MRLNTLFDTSPPRHQLLSKTMPPLYPWDEVIKEVDLRTREGREAALIYDIRRPIYTSYGIVIDEVEDIQRDLYFMLPLLQYQNELTIWLLAVAILGQVAGLICLLVRRSR